MTASRHGVREIVMSRLVDLDRTQEWLGEAMAGVLGREFPYSQQAVSAWLQGNVPLRPTEAFAMEKALGFKPGQLTRHLGFVPAGARPFGSTPESAIANDERLTDRDRRVLLALYRELLEAE